MHRLCNFRNLTGPRCLCQIFVALGGSVVKTGTLGDITHSYAASDLVTEDGVEILTASPYRASLAAGQDAA